MKHGPESWELLFGERYVPITETGCYVFGGAWSKTGYSVITYKQIVYLAHRLSYEKMFGNIPVGMLVCHKCDVRSCINPSHLFLGSHSDNSRDMKSKKRHTYGSKNGMNKLTLDQAIAAKEGARPAWEIAKELGVSRSLIYKIRSGSVWAHL